MPVPVCAVCLAQTKRLGGSSLSRTATHKQPPLDSIRSPQVGLLLLLRDQLLPHGASVSCREEMAVGEDYYYYSDSDDDDDVDRYVFLARQPEPARRHEQQDGDGDETEDEEGGYGRRRGKRPLIRDASPSPNKKARLGLIVALPSTPTSSGTDRTASSTPRGGVWGRESSDSEETHEEARDEHPDQRKGKGNRNKTKKPLGVCGKKKRSIPGCEEEVDQVPRRRDVMTAAAAATSAGRFQCSLCERCFDCHRALGGHVLGHQKKARIAAAIAAAASHGDAGGRGNCKAEVAAVELYHEDANNGVDYAKQKTPVVAAPDYAKGNGSCHEKKAFHDIDDAACQEDNVDRGGFRKAKKTKKSSVVAEDHHPDAHGGGIIDMRRTSMFAPSYQGANDHDRNREKAASSRSFHIGSEEKAIGAGRSHNNPDVTNKKAAAGASRNGGAADGNSNNVDACRMQQYKCKVCGTECPTGRALGGHMRKHRKQPAQGGADDGLQAALVIAAGGGGMRASG